MLALDVGNTFTKWRHYSAPDRVEEGKYLTQTILGTTIEIIERLKVKKVFAAWVGANAQKQKLRDAVTEIGVNFILIQSEPCRSGLKNGYADYYLLGVDRWLAMLAVWSKYKNGFCVVDSGTALTIDFVRQDGQHLGGYILPGLRTMISSLNLSTALINCELIDESSRPVSPGLSTKDAVQNGALISLVGAMEYSLKTSGLIEEGRHIRCFVGGGDARLLKPLLGPHWELEGELVLDGIFAYLQVEQIV